MIEVNGGSVRFLAVLKVKGDVLEELGLVPFDGEMIMGLSVFNQIAGELASRGRLRKPRSTVAVRDQDGLDHANVDVADDVFARRVRRNPLV
jgi:hypothetical protein